MIKLTKPQNELIEKSSSFKPNEQINEIYSYWFQSIIIKTFGGSYFKITAEGNIEDASYHNVVFDEPIEVFGR